MKENMVFLTKYFLSQEDRGKMRIKNYRGDHHEFRDFGENFMIFGQVELLK
jgi:hypothetical protein